jgi:hypothetical protein
VDDGGLSALIDFGNVNCARGTSALKIKLPLAVAGTLKSPPYALNERLHSFSFGVGDDNGNAEVLVSARAIIQRIKRKLHEDDQVLKRARGARARFDFGDMYVLDWRRK